MIRLPFPAKILWPNGRGHPMAKYRAVKKHREWARNATLAWRERPTVPSGATVQLSITVSPKTRHAIDADNAIAAMKSYQDGIADALKVDDSRFALTALRFAEPVRGGQVVIRVLFRQDENRQPPGEQL